MTTDDRRPIPARDYGLSKRITHWLISKGLSANQISVIGMGFALAAGLLLTVTQESGIISRICWLLAGLGIFLRLLANMFDGMVALATGTASPVGELYNEIPDRLSDTFILIGAGYTAGGWPEMGYLAALTALLTAYVRATGKAAGTAQQFCGPFAKQQRMFTLIGVCLYMALTPVSWHITLLDLQIPALGLLVIFMGSLVTCWRRLHRIAQALHTNRPADIGAEEATHEPSS